MQCLHAVPVLSLLILAACASAPEAQENQPSASAPAAVTAPPVAEPVAATPVQPVFSDAQFEKLDKALAIQAPRAFVRKLQVEARPTIREFLSKNACVTDTDASALQALAVAAKDFPATGYAAPMAVLAGHDKRTCLTLRRLGGWVAPTGTSLRFEATYEASTGKTSKIHHEVRRQRNGKWAVLR